MSTTPTQPLHIERYSKCPKKTYYSWDVAPKLSPTSEIIRRVICKIYTFAAKQYRPPTFNLIVHWYEIEYKRIIKEYPNYIGGQEVFSRLNTWYERYYLNSTVQAIANVPISVSFRGQPYLDVIDVVEVGDKVKVHDFKELLDEKDAIGTVIYNDIKVHARLWGLELASGVIPNEYVRWVILPHSIRYLSIEVNERLLEKSRKIVQHILQGIALEAWYPSVSEQCAHCPYSSYCSL